ncbi:cation:proton antiporter [Bacillus sp. AFS053548]|uniref:cation:proton antiporter n=1 Tax=Bacillus sp. AFS053548 TaxID=2033505 RepID=UPI000BFB5A2D|nr:cation:proton antiporter [Bacillus sp. AFS053548]PGM59457.1 sodium:proton antiporter [Bacillus sp. AFS053548]
MLYVQLAIILIASKVFGDLSTKLGQPAVLGKLLIGIILGPAVLGIITETETLHEMSEIGVILLMFIAGLETDVNEFKRTGKASSYVGVLGILFPLFSGYLYGISINLSQFEAIFLGLILSATSVSISVATLKEMGKLKTKDGATILGAAVIDDIVVIIALAFVMSFSGSAVSLPILLFKKFIFFTFAILIGWKIVPWFLKKFIKLNVSETLISAALIVCFLFSAFADQTGIAAIIGAYFAGISISVTKFKQEVFEKVETIAYSVFVPVFFTLIGVSVQFTGLSHSIPTIIMISIIAILTKLIGGALGAKLAGFPTKNSLGIGSAMVSRGEVALIMASTGLANNLLSKEMFAILVIVVLITTIVTPPLMKIFFSEKSEALNKKSEALN